MHSQSVEEKTVRILRLFGLILLLIAVRVFYLSTFAHEEHVEIAMKPQRREQILLPERGTICDRFGIPMAVNRIKYDAAILYDQIRDIPFVRVRRNVWGKKIKTYPRKEYVHTLSALLSEELSLDAQSIEDMIYSRASLFPNAPFVIKEDIPEKTFYRLKMFEKDYPGIAMQIHSKRSYPLGQVGCDVIGYLGMIHEGKYQRIADETRRLKHYLEECELGHAPPLPKGFESVQQVNERLSELREKAYTLNTQVGKGGVEGFYDEALRGNLGKKYYEVDIKGHILQELDGGRDPTSGTPLKLSISSELQEYAENLLAYSETLREERFEGAGRDHHLVPPPWIKGGAIVAMLPETGEIVALASYPRFNPNDFIGKKDLSVIHKWLESPTYFGAIWDGRELLEREHYDLTKNRPYTEKEILTWDTYLSYILSSESPIREALKKIETLDVALWHQREPIDLFDTPEEGALFLDLLALLADESLFTDELLEVAHSLTPSEYRALNQAKTSLEYELCPLVQSWFHKTDFQKWREEHFKTYLNAKRKKEKELKKVNKPYLDYLEAKERKFFKAFWEREKLTFLKALIQNSPLPESLKEYQGLLSTFQTRYPAYLEQLKKIPHLDLLSTMRSYRELEQPLRMKYRHTHNALLKDLAIAFAPHHFGYLSSEAFNQATPQGSIFKVVTALEGLRQHHKKNSREINPLTIIDDCPTNQTISIANQILGYTLDGKTIMRQYKGGTLPRSRPDIGKIDLKGAIERSSNIYFSLLASDALSHPLDLIQASKELGFGKRTGIDLPGEYPGLLPSDIRDNRSGLYSLAIGQHSLVVTPLQTALMFASLANGGQVLKPQIVQRGQAIPQRSLDLSSPIRHYLMEAMSLVINGEKGSARPSRIRTLYDHPPFLRTYVQLKKHLVGKTSTAEINYRPTLDPHMKPIKAKHIWFGGISFEDEAFEKPELVVVVYLKFGDYGKEAAPFAAAMVNKWREIQKTHKE